MKQPGDGAKVSAPSGTVTFLFSDIEGSTLRWGRDRAAMQEALRVHDRLMHEALAAHAGHVFKTVGDAFCAAFTTPESAAAAAYDAQRALNAADFSAVEGLRVRMAINTGTADERDGDYFGPALNRVARLLSLGHGGQVLLSGVAADLVRENPPPYTSLLDLGERTLKDFEGRERVYQLVAPTLQREFPDLRTRKSVAPWLVPDAMRTRYFAGREQLLALLGRQLAEHHRAALSGLGGVGKSQAAIEYAVRHRADYSHGIFWVDAETESGLTSGFVKIADALGLPESASSDHAQVVRATLDWMSEHDCWLLILDNVEDRRQIVRFVPPHGKGDVLLTSREPVFQELGIARALEVGDLASDESVRFLLTRTGRVESEAAERDAVSQLAADLGNLPLALEQAAAYVTETDVTFADYLSAFRKRRVTLLEKSRQLVPRDTVAVTWAANFEAVDRISSAATEVLSVSAFLAPDAIPFEFLLEGAPALGAPIAETLQDPDELAIAELLRPLVRYSLIRSDAAARSYGVHRLVQEIVREKIGENERRKYVDRAAGALSAAFPEVEFATWARCDRLVPHVASVAAWLDAYGSFSAAGARVLRSAGRYLIERGRYAESEVLYERSLAIAERAHGSDHAEVAASLHGLGSARLERGRYAEARPLLDRALAMRERALGVDHPDVAATLYNLGLVASSLGQYAESQGLNQRALTIRERAFGLNHPAVANSLTNLAHVHNLQGRYGEAQRLNERALAIREGALGPDHPHVALSLFNLAGLCATQGKYAEAQPLHERALAIYENALGSNHEDVARSLNALAELSLRQERYAEAETLYRRALATYETAVGDHDASASSLDGLASLNLKQGRAAEARTLYERALATRERTLGPDHPDVARSVDGLANVRLSEGRFDDAEALFARALDIRERALGSDHPDVTPSLLGLASIRKQQDRDAEAIAFFERATNIRERSFAVDDPEIEEMPKRRTRPSR